MTGRKKVLFICGSLNQTTQMHQISRHLPGYDHFFTPYYADGLLEFLRTRRLLEFTILGFKLRERCVGYLEKQGLALDPGGRRGGYSLVVTCSDLVVQRNARQGRLVVVQEGILDPPGLLLEAWMRFPFLPRWIAGTATTGLSGAYDRFCVASEGYRDYFVEHGADPARVMVTGIPNFDDCAKYRQNEFPHKDYVLVCTSDARETFKRDDRGAFIRTALRIAQGRKLIFKLHPNENAPRATREIHRHAPGALVFSSGSAEEMIANCEVLVTQYSSTVFVGLALGKEVHSYHGLDTLRRLLPVQNASAARRIAEVGRRLLEDAPLGLPEGARESAGPAAQGELRAVGGLSPAEVP